ncbi:MAG: DUF3857 domain-containing protein [Myxococcota bacterium]
MPPLLFLIAVATPADPSPPYSISPEFPSWVHEVSVDRTTQLKPSNLATHELLWDRQERVSKGHTERFVRSMRRLRTHEGVQQNSSVEIDVDPEYQRLRIHRVDLIRDGTVIDGLATATIRVVQQEDELSRQIYNGELTITIVLEDVRSGDVLDYAWTVEGEHPAMRGHLATSAWLAGFEPVEQVRFRLLWPKDRFLNWRTQVVQLAPTVRETGELREYTWVRSRPEPVAWEDNAPSAHAQLPMVLVSSFESWADVSRWASANYELPPTLHPTLRALATKIRDQHADRSSQLRAALEFVQQDVRYFGIEVGARSLIPHPPHETLRRRFGDCKDKTQLLRALLRELEISAVPVLVHSDKGDRVPTLLPSPNAFNHVIARVSIDRDRYFDATSAFSRGPFDELEALGLGYGLDISPGGAELTELPKETLDRPAITVVERASVERGKTVGHLRVETVFRGREAHRQRARFQSQSLEDASRRALNFYAETDDDIEIERPLEISDDTKKNVYTIREWYRIPDYWNSHARDFDLWFVRSAFVRPDVVVREVPLKIEPAHIRHVIEFVTPTEWHITPEKVSLRGDTFEFDYERSYRGKTLLLDATLRTLSEEVAPENMRSYLAELDRIREELGFSIWEGSGPSTARPVDPMAVVVWIGVFLGIALTWGGHRVWSRRRRRAFRKKGMTARGETPHDPLEVHNWKAACEVVAGRPCRECRGGTHEPLDSEPESLSFDGKRLLAARFRCTKCDSVKSLYFQLAETTSEPAEVQ